MSFILKNGLIDVKSLPIKLQLMNPYAAKWLQITWKSDFFYTKSIIYVVSLQTWSGIYKEIHI
jgi:hypothetical protein